MSSVNLYYRIALLICFIHVVSGKWVWRCSETEGACERTFPDDSSDNLYSSIELCRLVCGSSGNIWPLPSTYSINDKTLLTIDIRHVQFNITSDEAVKQFLNDVVSYFSDTIDSSTRVCTKDSYGLRINIYARSKSLILNWNTDESYEIRTATDENNRQVVINITGETVFGVRHGVETLLQLIVKDQDCFASIKSYYINDKPFYKHRGLLLDTARNYLSVDVIKKNIVGMGMSKMNVLHWHLTDSQSFPFVSSRLPNMTSYGAYDDKQVYQTKDVNDLIKFAKIRGIRILPEIDAPAHVGNGWQWGSNAGLGNLVVCQNQQPWRSFCIQPPCGQLNPANPWIYYILRNIYSDIIDLWTDIDAFHMGGDEVYIPCWNSSEEILRYIGTTNRSEEVFLKLWTEFQTKALDAFDVARGGASTTAIVWTSSLTQPGVIENSLPKERYVIQTWVASTDALPKELIDLGYKIIISTKDRWYLDHGFWGTTTFHNWRKVYDNLIPTEEGVLGGEVCMWGELVDDNNVEDRVWPRAAAAAERLWSNLQTTSVEAERRFFVHNSRLVSRGIRSSIPTPTYCVQNENDCTGYLTYY